MDIPEVGRLSEFIGSVVPGATVPNPLDATGFMKPSPRVVEQIMKTYLSAPEFDASIFLSQFADWDMRGGRKGAEGLRPAHPGGRGRHLDHRPLAGNGGQWLEGLRSETASPSATGCAAACAG